MDFGLAGKGHVWEYHVSAISISRSLKHSWLFWTSLAYPHCKCTVSWADWWAVYTGLQPQHNWAVELCGARERKLVLAAKAQAPTGVSRPQAWPSVCSSRPHNVQRKIYKVKRIKSLMTHMGRLSDDQPLHQPWIVRRTEYFNHLRKRADNGKGGKREGFSKKGGREDKGGSGSVRVIRSRVIFTLRWC